MKELEIKLENGGVEKNIIFSTGEISFDNSDESVYSKHNISTIVIGGNGDFSPPFSKGSRLLREIRNTSGMPIDSWELVLPLNANKIRSSNFYKENITNEGHKENDENWGIWLYKSSEEDIFPDIIIINYPFWLITKDLEIETIGSSIENIRESLLQIYKIILSELNTVCSLRYLNNTRSNNRFLYMSDIGNNLIDKVRIKKLTEGDLDDLFKLRSTTMIQVLIEWLIKNNFFSKIIIGASEYGIDFIEKEWCQ